MSKPPLTKAKTGSTRCPGCDKRFTDTADQATVDIEGTEQDAPGRNSVGFVHRHTRHAVTRRWHAQCLADFEAANEASRQRAAAEHEQMIRDLCEQAGLDYEQVKAEHERRQAEDA